MRSSPSVEFTFEKKFLLRSIDQEDRRGLSSQQISCFVHYLPKYTFDAEIGIHKKGALHERVDGAVERLVATDALLSIRILDCLTDGLAVSAENLGKILLDCISQGVVRKHGLLAQNLVAYRRSIVILQPTFDVAPLVGVTIAKDYWVVHDLLRDRAIERWRMLPSARWR
jgi:hypothetical protein